MTTTKGDSYIYDQQWEAERARLAGLSAAFDDTTLRHLTAAGLTAGWHCLEVGAGAGSIARRLGEFVGPGGRVVATDLDTRFLGDLGPPVEVRRHDVTADPLDAQAFDLVHARAVLEHVPGRAAVLDRLVAALRPGGVIVVEDVVFGGHAARLGEPVTRPAGSAETLGRVMDAIAGGFRAIGADPEYGLQLPGALHAAGLTGVTAELTYLLIEGGSPQAAFYELSLRQLAGRLVDAGLLAPQDAAEVSAFVTDPQACWLSIGLLSATGRVPGTDN